MIPNNSKDAQLGWTGIGFLGILASCLVGGIIGRSIGSSLQTVNSLPWILVTIQLAVIPFTLIVRSKVGEVREIEGLSATEERRLERIVREKIHQFDTAIISFLIMAIISVTALLIGSSDESLIRIAFSVVFSFAFICIFSFWLILKESSEIDVFKSDMLKRRARKKKAKAAINSLKKKKIELA